MIKKKIALETIFDLGITFFASVMGLKLFVVRFLLH